METCDVIVVGGGPAGATAAEHLARSGASVVLLDKAGRIKPCGGAIPPRAIRDYAIPDALICAKVDSARMISPSDRAVDMPIENGYVGMVDRDVFDEFLRNRAAEAGARRVKGTYLAIDRSDGQPLVRYRDADGTEVAIKTRLVIGADGARSAVAKQALNGSMTKSVFAYHEIIESPADGPAFDAKRCEVYYQGKLSPDFYAWVFPHGKTASIGVGSAHKGFSLRGAVRDLRVATGLDTAVTTRTEGAPIPLKPLKKWDNGRDVVVIGDAAGVVAPASGEGIYYAMASGEMAAEEGLRALAGQPRALANIRKRFMKAHGRVFMVLGIMQWFWYANDKRRERFVTMCADPDVQQLTFEAYMNKRLVRRKPGAHLKIFLKDTAHLLRIVKPVKDGDGAAKA
ncbi:geranylgeranyl diphosphate reductase [Acuticoccus sp. MNP-M23]|uniref:geranylgeranyl diphosphate reductase n=1 Tax=Acuticoccus sp. MNP-M23 TaxID=3072793 RepID=UPI00281559AA|nr:geranylgeranyl diphosphate reductase [Acuticoccus sp. MNP-M23]WMS42696.1 geranylgeranyl diphosphate reductase [Acuticoccus sp. MNP-M23]